jgi:hypothetical protein
MNDYSWTESGLVAFCTTLSAITGVAILAAYIVHNWATLERLSKR